jgi:hypothetical protein
MATITAQGAGELMKPIGFAARGHGPKSLSDSAIWQFGQAPMQKPDWGAVSEVNRKKF